MSEPTPLARLCRTLDEIPDALLDRLPPGIGKRIQELRYQAASGTSDRELRMGLEALANDGNLIWLKLLPFSDQARVRAVLRQVTKTSKSATGEDG